MNLMANQFLDKVSLTEYPSSLVMNIADQEEIKPPRDTTMLIWDSNMIMLSDNLFESHEQPMEVSVIQTCIKGLPGSRDIDITQALKIMLTPDRLKTYFTLGKNPIHIHTQESPKLDYNVVKVLKKLKSNISVMDICKIPQ
jgi:hypothetical protein